MDAASSNLVVPTYCRTIYEDFSVLEEQKFAVEKKSEPRGDPLHTHLGAKNDKGGPSIFCPFLGSAKSANFFSSVRE
jgi:hypothetical protein